MPEGAVSSGTVLAAAASTWISGGGGGSVWKYVPGPYSWPYRTHDPAVLEHSALVPGDSLTASAVEVPGHALGEEPVRPSGSSRIQQVAGAFGARASVGLVVDQVRVVGQVRDLVDDGVGCVPHDHVAQRVGVEHVAHVGLRPERVQDRDLVGRARQPEHVVTGRDEQRHQPDSDDAGRTGHHDPHPSTIRRALSRSPPPRSASRSARARAGSPRPRGRTRRSRPARRRTRGRRPGTTRS